MEDAAGLNPGRRSPRLRTRRAALAVAWTLILGPGLTPTPVPGAPAPASPGTVWGRLASEEESPDGPWTPLGGVEVRLVPDPRPLAAELERIRQGARVSWRDHDQAIARVEAALHAHRVRVEGAGAVTHHAVTDAWGTFVLEDVAPGDWLLVAVRTGPYRRTAAPGARRGPARGRGGGFSGEETAPAKEAEVWMTTVHLDAGGRTSVLLTDRARWMAGPVR